MYILDDGIRLNAKLDHPQGSSQKQPLLIIIHGFTGHIEERHIIAVAETANALGMATLRADMYGHGHSDGAFEDHNLFKWQNNALAIIDYARSLPFVSDIYLAGHSQGGLMTMLAGALKQDVIRGLLPLSPAWMIPEMARKGELLGQTFDPVHVPEYIGEWHDKRLKGNYARVAQMIRVEDAIERYDGPVLIVHGDADETVPYEYGIKAAKLYRHSDFVTIPGDTHCYDYHLEMVTEAVHDWLERQLTV
ncbi:MAG: alpha/beta fold hydrolase [Clostridia bacterium]|nr:alpha/beta fold hydrolase [Clostridia bacterium]